MAFYKTLFVKIQMSNSQSNPRCCRSLCWVHIWQVLWRQIWQCYPAHQPWQWLSWEKHNDSDIKQTKLTACVHHILTKSIRALIKNNEIRSIFPESLASYFMQLSTHNASLNCICLIPYQSIRLFSPATHAEHGLKCVGFSASNLSSVLPY